MNTDKTEQKNMDHVRIFDVAVLRDWTASVLRAVNVPDGDATIAAESLLLANLRGVDTHGIGLLVDYSKALGEGGLNPTPNMRIAKENDACFVFDGDGGMGQIICTRAMDAAIERAKVSGVSVGVTTHASHCGMLAAYVLRAVEENMIGVLLSDSGPSMAPTGGYEWILSNSPMSMGIPNADTGPIVVDQATAGLSWRGVLGMAAMGLDLPDNVIMWRKPEGGTMKDGSRAIEEGTAVPIGGHKGYGLALVLECLTGALSGGPFGPDVSTVSVYPEKRENISQFVLVISPQAFMPLDTYKQRVADYIRYVKNSPRLQGVDEILIPGEKEARCTQERMENGIPLPPDIMEGLDSLAKQVGVKPLAT